LALALAVLATVLAITIPRISSRSDARPKPAGTQSLRAAPPFTLATVDGSPVSLADFRGKQNVLLYFSEAADCPPGWKQAEDLQADFTKFRDLDVRVFIVMFDSPALLREEASRRGLADIPILSDTDLQVTRSFDALGGMHADKPRHAFVLIDKGGNISWRWDYAGEDVNQMYISDQIILQQVRQALSVS